MPGLKLELETQLFIGGEFRPARSGRRFTTVNPATEEVIAEVAEAGPEDVDEAVRAARSAFEAGSWAAIGAKRRGELLWRMGELVKGKWLEPLSEAETADTGKTLFDSGRVELPLAGDIFQYYAGWATKLGGETVPVRGGAFAYTLREPVGVAGLVVPWNFPFLLACWKIAPALAAGCTVVVKPSSQTPLSALLLGALAREAGLPPGVLNVLPGPGSAAGMALVRHPGVDKVAFTGSTEVGREVMRAAADGVKRVTLELGGKSPNLVFADAHLRAAAKGALGGIFYNKGEVCAAGSRLLVERRVFDEVAGLVVEGAKKLTLGDPRRKETRLGPLVSAAQREKVLSYVKAGRAAGAPLLCGGEAASVDGKGFYVQATVLGPVSNDSQLAREEVFGPVLAIVPFEDEADAVRLANETAYGLAAGVWTTDVKRAHRVSRALRAGTVWVNAYNLYDPALPFGGYKQSGFGRELGEAGLDAYTETKSVWVDLGV
ncbi:MAG TPA: aldehyde dehydrogenase family protein [Anaeromyxobacteraceae bacterium]|jgi:acyl-CoA reductase-like NAD-dependent aldehyde dehydrogenase|nr:aldehyde dehydrogenase family protein [Anaeromyxobacteraceae bacterium]